MTDQATAVTITIDPDNLNGYTDSHIAALWHVAQANPVPHGDRDAGKLAEAIGYEIIRRFLRSTSPELYVHKSDDHYWHALTQHCTWNGTEWVRKDAADDVASKPERVPYSGLSLPKSRSSFSNINPASAEISANTSATTDTGASLPKTDSQIDCAVTSRS